MPSINDPVERLRLNRMNAVRYAKASSGKHVIALLKRARVDLDTRLSKAEGLSGPGKDTFTSAQLRVAKEELKRIMIPLQRGLSDLIAEKSKFVSEAAVQGSLKYMSDMEKKYTGIGAAAAPRLHEAMILDKIVSDTEASVLRRLGTSGEPQSSMKLPHKGKQGILDRYGLSVVEKFEQSLQLRFAAQKPWAEVRASVIKDSPFIAAKGKPAAQMWAERIVRTEVMAANNRANWQTIAEANEVIGDAIKILAATFDDRTAADSYAVHGQIRRVNEPFESWYGAYMSPPNRPNDREIVVAHRLAWPLPPELAWKSDAEISAAWMREGRKGGIPSRPKMTTIPIEEFGKAKPPPKAPAKAPGVPVAPTPPKLPKTPLKHPPTAKKLKELTQLQAVQKEAAEQAKAQAKIEAAAAKKAAAEAKKLAKAMKVEAAKVAALEKEAKKAAEKAKKYQAAMAKKVKAWHVAEAAKAKAKAAAEAKAKVAAEQAAKAAAAAKVKAAAAAKVKAAAEAKAVEDAALKAKAEEAAKLKAKHAAAMAKVKAASAKAKAAVKATSAAAMKKADKDVAKAVKEKAKPVPLTAGDKAYAKFKKAEEKYIELQAAADKAQKEAVLFGKSQWYKTAKLKSQAAYTMKEIAHKKAVEAAKAEGKPIEYFDATHSVKKAAAFEKEMKKAAAASAKKVAKDTAEYKKMMAPGGGVKAQRLTETQLQKKMSSLDSIQLPTVDTIPEGADVDSYRKSIEARLKKAKGAQRDGLKAFSYQHDYVMRELDRGVSKEDVIKNTMKYKYSLRTEATAFVEKCQKHMADVNKMFANDAITLKNTTVYRGMGNLDAETASRFSTKGSEITFSSMSSTSRSADVASGFAHKGSDKHAIIFRMKIKRGIGFETISRFKSEHEILVEGKARYRVIDVKKMPSGKLFVDLEEI